MIDRRVRRQLTRVLRSALVLSCNRHVHNSPPLACRPGGRPGTERADNKVDARSAAKKQNLWSAGQEGKATISSGRPAYLLYAPGPTELPRLTRGVLFNCITMANDQENTGRSGLRWEIQRILSVRKAFGAGGIFAPYLRHRMALPFWGHSVF